ncbi:hypothetical protein BDQ12DRAFT_717744 [Crucibulum laeve]|uniref:THO1-MOS11 C-terminal domain-containing protein n=1 Tax=Crucibulum laeve TaxID=68775 RepID=A0A5C3MKZ3_9AGAR|nr:hypothetical protein BDQ12DRAFT_717744 [Crucibulum laeve]
MESKLKALKVVDLKNILATAGVAVPAKATKPDLITRILASQPALDAYDALYPSRNSQHAATVPISQPAKQPAPPPAPSPKPPPSAAKQLPPAPQADYVPAPASESTDSSAPPQDDAPTDPELEKRRQRAARFGIPIVEPTKQPTAKQSRAKDIARNGAPNPVKTPIIDDPEKLQARAARFGIEAKAAAAPKTSQKRAAPVEQVDAEEQERRKKRAERFGLAQPTTTA